ncbi:MAG: hypothetical protein R6V78_11800 [Desulfosarcina sp.]
MISILTIPEQVLTFLNRLTEDNKPYTKRVRLSQLSSCFNFARNNIDPDGRNPCDTPMIRKLYRERVPSRWEIIEKETVDELIFRPNNQSPQSVDPGIDGPRRHAHWKAKG